MTETDVTNIQTYKSSLKIVTFTDQIESIYQKAFYYFSSLEKVVFNDGSSLRSIGNSAFYYCYGLSKIEGVFTNLKSIGASAFYYCWRLPSFPLIPSVTSIDTGAFRDAGFREFTMPAGITAPKPSIFRGCWYLVTVTWNANVMSISDSMFDGCQSLVNLVMDFDNLLTIGASAFSGCTKLTSIPVAPNLTNIGASAFSNSGLVEFYMSSKVTSVPTSAFSGCANLMNILCGDGITSIGVSAFQGCVMLSKFPTLSTISLIGDDAFRGSGLTEFVIPSGSISIGSRIFQDCSKMTKVVIRTYMVTFPGSVFSGCTNLEEISADFRYLKTIGNYAFKGCTKLKSFPQAPQLTTLGQGSFMLSGLTEFVIPSGITSIGGDAFRECFDLVHISGKPMNASGPHELENVDYINSYAFYGCSKLSNFPTAPKLKTISNYAFQKCSKLGCFPFLPKLTFLGEGAFRESGITEIRLPSGITALKYGLFYRCYDLCKVVIDGKITSIGSWVFTACDKLEIVPVDFSELTSIGEYTFNGCPLTSFVAPKLTTLSVGVFLLAGLTEFEIPSSVKITSNTTARLFYLCYNLTKVTIGSGVTYIPDEMFASCISLETLNADFTRITGIGPRAFQKCYKLRSLEMPNLNKISAAAFSFSGLTSFTIPVGVTSLSDGIFSGCANLQRISIKYSIESIPAQTFCDCVNLEMVDLNWTAIKYVYQQAFQGCKKITCIPISPNIVTMSGSAFSTSGVVKVTVPESVKGFRDSYFGTYYWWIEEVQCDAIVSVIPYGLFRGCSKLKTLNMNLTAVANVNEYAFYGCKSLEHLPSMPNAVLSEFSLQESGIVEFVYPKAGQILWDGTFMGCSKLKKVVSGGAWNGISAKMFYNCRSLEVIDMNFSNAKRVQQYAFYGCTSLLSLPYMPSLNTIYTGAFMYSGITEFVIPVGVTSLAESTFEYCRNLQRIRIEYSIESIPAQTFCDCVNLEMVDLNWTAIKYVYQQAFQRCKKITCIPISPNIVTMSGSAFSTSGVVKVTVPESVKGFRDSYFNKYYWWIEEVQCDAIVDEIPYGLFRGCSKLKTLNMNLTAVANVNEYAFYGCKSLERLPSMPNAVLREFALQESGIVEFVYPKAGQTLWDGTFMGCSKLKKVVSGAVWTAISAKMFYNCRSLEVIDVTFSNAKHIYQYAFYGCTSLLSLPYMPSLNAICTGAFMYSGITEFVIPVNVTSLAESTFEYCRNLKRVVVQSNSVTEIPKSFLLNCLNCEIFCIDLSQVTTIEAYSFYGCSKLKEFPRIPNVKTIGDYAFTGCGMTNFTLEKVVTLSSGLFARCENLRKFTYRAASLTSIPAELFSGCSNLNIISLDLSSTTSIGEGAFRGCRKLIDFVLPENLKNVSQYLFYDCSELKNVNIPDELETIGSYAFAKCYHLEKISLPDVPISIGQGAFQDCTALFKVEKSDSPTFSNNVFDNCRNLKTFTVNQDIPNEMFIRSGIETVIIGESVRSIGLRAFYDCKRLETVNITGDSQLVSIQSEAFSGCTSLKEMVCPPRLQNITEYAFYGCRELRSVSFPVSLVSISDYAFAMSGITSVVISSCSVFGSNAFSQCNNLYSVELKGEVTSVGDYLFANCSQLSKLTLDNSFKMLGNYMFGWCSSLTEISLSRDVEYIGTHVFADSGIQSFSFPDHWAVIGESMFENCYSLTQISLPTNVITINPRAFALSGLKEVVIPASWTNLGEGMFYGCYSLSKVILPSGVLELPNEVFYQCSQLDIHVPRSVMKIGSRALAGTAITSFIFENGVEYGEEFMTYCDVRKVTIPSTWTSIPNYLLQGCRYLTSIKIPGGVISIGDMAFCDCRNVEEVILPDTLETIGNLAFSSMEKIKNISLPSTVTSLGDGVFSGCVSLVEVRLPEKLNTTGNDLFAGCQMLRVIELQSVLSRISDRMFSGCSSIEKYEVPVNVAVIGEYAFEDCTNMETVVLHSKITEIGKYAFSSCQKLSSLVIPENVVNLPDGLFFNCTSLSTVTLHNGIDELGKSVFSGCQKLKTVELPLNLSQIPAYTFYNCLGFETYEIPTSVSIIGDYAFSHCHNLISVLFHWGVTEIGRYAFSECHNLSFVEIPQYVAISDVNCSNATISNTTDLNMTDPEVEQVVYNITIGTGAFSGCVKLSAVELPSSFSEIPESMFIHCTALTEYVVPEGVSVIGSDAFWGCVGLASVILHPNITEIGSYAFYMCSSLTSLNIPNSITHVSAGLVCCCTSLQVINLYDSIKSIGQSAFSGCQSLEKVDLPNTITEISFGCFSNTGFIEYDIPVKITVIGDYAFSQCSKLEEIVFHDDIKEIGEYAFSCTSLKNLVILSSFNSTGKVIGAYAFQGCTELLTVEISDNVDISDADGLFKDCVKLESVLIDTELETLPWYFFYNCSSMLFENVAARYVKKYEVGTFGYWLNLREFAIPEYLDEIPARFLIGCKNLETVYFHNNVAQIGHQVFKDCVRLQKIEFPSSLYYIGEEALMNCENIVNVVLPNLITNIPAGLFSGCKSLTSFTIESTILSMEESAFSGCTGLLSFTFPDRFEYLPDGFLAGCTQLETVTLPKTLYEIPKNLFANCTSIKTVSLPDTVLKIGESAFENCVSLLKISVPEKVTEIAKYAFAGSGIRTIKLPSKVTTISEGLFSRCNSLTNLVIPDTVYSIEMYAFANCANLVSLMVPEGLEEYKEGVLMNCTSLQMIHIPHNMQKINKNAFSGCQSLRDVTFSSKLTMIDDFAFANSGLVEVVIPGSVRTLGREVFANCSSLVLITYCVSVIDQCRTDTFAYYSGSVSVPSTYPETTICGADTIRDQLMCTSGASSKTGIVQITEPHEARIDIDKNSYVIVKDIDYATVDTMSVSEGTSVAISGTLAIVFSLSMADGSSISSDSLMMANDGQAVVEIEIASANAPMVSLGDVSNQNVPKEILIQIDNEKMSSEDLSALSHRPIPIISASNSFNCETWNSVVTITVKSDSNYEWTSQCRENQKEILLVVEESNALHSVAIAAVALGCIALITVAIIATAFLCKGKAGNSSEPANDWSNSGDEQVGSIIEGIKLDSLDNSTPGSPWNDDDMI